MSVSKRIGPRASPGSLVGVINHVPCPLHQIAFNIHEKVHLFTLPP